MPQTLTVLSGKNASTKYVLTGDELRMGRHPDCEIVIHLNAVSRFHAHLLREGDGYVVEDLESRNGTYVNGKKIQGRVLLKDNDRIKICDHLYVYRRTPDASPVDSDFISEPDDTSQVLTSMDAAGSSSIITKTQPEAKLRAVLEITEAIGQTLELDELFPKILDCLFKIFPFADRALVIEEHGEQLIPRAVKHRRESDDAIRFSKTIVRQAIKEKKAILSADASNDSRFEMAQSLTDFRIRSVMCVPMFSQAQAPLGVIQIDSVNQSRKFEPDDLEILKSIAIQASFAVENAKLHEDLVLGELIQRELELARRVQQSFLPKTMPRIPAYDFWAHYEAAGMVGGDYYDFIPLPNGKIAILLGDVSGKGVPAALMMAKASSDAKVSLLTYPDDPVTACCRLNNSVCNANLEDKFITLVMCLLDPANSTISIVNAGHMSPIIRRRDGSLEEPAGEAVSGLPIGIIEDTTYESVTANLGPGDKVVLFSDGISEAMNSEQRQYSINRLRCVIESQIGEVAKSGENILVDVRNHVNGYKQSDDIAMVLFGRKE